MKLKTLSEWCVLVRRAGLSGGSVRTKTLAVEAEIWLSMMRSHQRDQALNVTRRLQLGASSIRALVVLKVSSRLNTFLASLLMCCLRVVKQRPCLPEGQHFSLPRESR
jgi:hypothetical protein